jgi:hypothetical protein
MVEVVQSGQFRAYSDFDNRSLSRNPQRAAVINLPVIDISSFLSQSCPCRKLNSVGVA